MTAQCWVTAALSVCYRKIFCCQQFCKVTLDCHRERRKGHLFICLPPQTVNSFSDVFPHPLLTASELMTVFYFAHVTLVWLFGIDLSVQKQSHSILWLGWFWNVCLRKYFWILSCCKTTYCLGIPTLLFQTLPERLRENVGLCQKCPTIYRKRCPLLHNNKHIVLFYKSLCHSLTETYDELPVMSAQFAFKCTGSDSEER